MKNKVKSLTSRFVRYAAYGIPLLLVLMALITLICSIVVNNHRKHVYLSPAELIENQSSDKKVALVLGGGIDSNMKPTDVVMSRLDAGAYLYFEGVVDKLLVSGDNRFVNYNEPQVMQNYLENTHGIPSASIQQDSAGRSTYESCERAKKVFQLDELIVVSQQSHVPRAIYLCRSFGITAYGYPADRSHHRASQTLRELAANIKAVYNVHLFGEPTVLGDPIEL